LNFSNNVVFSNYHVCLLKSFNII